MDLKNDEGSVIDQNGKQIAVYKDEAGNITAMSAVCPHMGCLVDWNNADKTWDCPCHGSRFTKEGKVINGPAETDLKKEEISV